MIILGPLTVKAWRALSYDTILEVVKTALPAIPHPQLHRLFSRYCQTFTHVSSQPLSLSHTLHSAARRCQRGAAK